MTGTHQVPSPDTLLSRAFLIFKKSGIESVSEENLARELGISSDTLKSIAPDKKQLFLKAYRHDLLQQHEIHKKIISNAENAIEEMIGMLSNGIRNARQMSPAYMADMTKIPEAWEVIQQEIADYSLPLFKDILNRGVRQGVLRHDINIDIVSKVIMANVNVLFNSQAFPPERYPTEEVLRSIYMYYFRGLCTDAHVGLVEKYFSGSQV